MIKVVQLFVKILMLHGDYLPVSVTDPYHQHGRSNKLR